MLTDDNKLYVAQRDITVYKYLTYRKYGFFRTELYTAVQKMPVGSLYDIKGKEIKPKKPYNPDLLKRDIEHNQQAYVGEAYKHAYTPRLSSPKEPITSKAGAVWGQRKRLSSRKSLGEK